MRAACFGFLMKPSSGTSIQSIGEIISVYTDKHGFMGGKNLNMWRVLDINKVFKILIGV